VISLLIKISLKLKPYHKITYVLAFLILANLVYQLIAPLGEIKDEGGGAMFSLLALAWVALINLMLHIFTRIPEKTGNRQSFFTKIKNKLHQCLYYVLSIVFLGLSVALLILSVKMLRV